MTCMELNNDNLEKTIEDSDILLIDFGADWCGPCKMFEPIFDKASEKHSDITFARCDTQAQPEVAGKFGIRSIPTLAVFREQILVFMQAGALPEAALEDIIGQTRKLDMEDVRKKVAEEKAKQAAGEEAKQD